MKISELSARTGVPIPTIKFYLREGLLPPGERTAKNQARYTETHVSLLGLIRTLQQALGMRVDTIARILSAYPRSGSEFLDAGLATIAASRAGARTLDRESSAYHTAETLLRSIYEKVGWPSTTCDAASEDAIAALLTIQKIWPDLCQTEHLEPYARLARSLAAIEIPDDWDPEGRPIESFTYAVLGTYLLEPLILALRRVAHHLRATELTQRHHPDDARER